MTRPQLNPDYYDEYEKSPKKKQLIPAGMHAARLYSVIDVGTQNDFWQGKAKSSAVMVLLKTFLEQFQELTQTHYLKEAIYAGIFPLGWLRISLLKKRNPLICMTC